MPDYQRQAWRQDRLDPALPTGLILGGMGGPDGPEAVEPFLRNMFADPAIMPLPPWLGRLAGRLIVRRRVAAAKQRYIAIGFGGGSPQRLWTEKQAARLAELLAGSQLQIEPACAMRYWHPYSDETVSALLARGVRQLVVVPTYPQYSTATSGSILGEITRTCARLAPHLPLHVIPDWHLLPGFVQALAKRTASALTDWAAAGHEPSTCGVVWTAHSLPEHFVKHGDPYLEQTRATVQAAHEALTTALGDHDQWWQQVSGGDSPLLAFQCKLAVVRWIGPDLAALTRQLGAAGCRRLLIVPVSFTCEHIETLHVLDRNLAATATGHGVTEFQRISALNLDEGWLSDLARLLATRAFGLDAQP